MRAAFPFALASVAFVIVACAALRSASAATSTRAPLCANRGADICLSSCDELVSRLDSRVAPGIVSCLRHANSGETCVPPAAYACVEGALATARSDALAEADCDRLARACSGKKAAPGWRRNCSSVFPSLTSHGRSAVVACMSKQDCAGMPYFDQDVGSCVFADVVA
ncbi:MAG TPA: hypothetical protein VGH28_31095 [Polyangiaceae bacterium]|jgi:hypothetical protein